MIKFVLKQLVLYCTYTIPGSACVPKHREWAVRLKTREDTMNRIL